MHAADIRPGMKVAVRHGVLKQYGVVVRLEDEHVIICRTHAPEWSNDREFKAHCEDVKPLDGWI